jgi:hypothetical protein
MWKIFKRNCRKRQVYDPSVDSFVRTFRQGFEMPKQHAGNNANPNKEKVSHALKVQFALE